MFGLFKNSEEKDCLTGVNVGDIKVVDGLTYKFNGVRWESKVFSTIQLLVTLRNGEKVYINYEYCQESYIKYYPDQYAKYGRLANVVGETATDHVKRMKNYKFRYLLGYTQSGSVVYNPNEILSIEVLGLLD
jgi:hypothetical protein